RRRRRGWTRIRSRRADVARVGVARFTEADVQVVVVAGVVARVARADENRVVEVDELEVVGSVARNDLDQGDGRRPIVARGRPARAPAPMAITTDGQDVHVQADLVRRVTGDVATVLKSYIAEAHRAESG